MFSFALRSVKNGEEQHLSVGHHVGERAHVIEKKRDKDGKIRQQQRFVNLDEGLILRFFI